MSHPFGVGTSRRRPWSVEPRKFPKGVIKYRTLEEAQADRDRWQKEHVRRIQKERLRTGKIRTVQTGSFK